jgi:hypothetical protein
VSGTTEQRQRRRHRFDPAAFLTGLVLLAVAVAFLLDASGAWRITRHGAVLLAGGGLVLATSSAIVSRIVRARRSATPPPGGGDDSVDGQ